MYTHIVTAQQAKALRTADAICFDTHPDKQGGQVKQIRAIFREEGDRSEYTVTVPVEVVRLQDYSKDGARGDYSAFEMVMSAKYDDAWQTMARRIKAGSVLGLTWHRDNASPITEEAGIKVDMLDLKVENTVRGKRVCDTFRVRTWVGLDNSARMVKRNRR